ncbi:hypothetical protein AHF37_09299 [Paragonimus kellicotti]|nr:hypothetical protein AHF37_09299 [Paragonimus kellicotti]
MADGTKRSIEVLAFLFTALAISEVISSDRDDFPSDVKRFLGPSVSPEEAGFIGFHRGRPERLLSYLNRRLAI